MRIRVVQTINGPAKYYVHTNGQERDTFPVIYDQESRTGWRRATESEIDKSSTGFEYRGWIYSLSEFDAAGDEVKALGFDGIQTDSYFSATVVRYFDEFGHELNGVIVGRIHW